MEATFRKSVAVEIAYLLLNSLGQMLNMSFPYAVMMNQTATGAEMLKSVQEKIWKQAFVY